MLGAADALPDIYTELEISYFLLRRLLGVRTEGDKKAAKVYRWICILNVGTMSTQMTFIIYKVSLGFFLSLDQ